MDTNQPIDSSTPEFKSHFNGFVEELYAKLQLGHEEYGDKSFSREPYALLDELKQEALDITGWGFILWVRLNKLQQKVNKL